MYTIKTLNAISPVGLAKLNNKQFDVAVDTDAPDGILVRSAERKGGDEEQYDVFSHGFPCRFICINGDNRLILHGIYEKKRTYVRFFSYIPCSIRRLSPFIQMKRHGKP